MRTLTRPHASLIAGCALLALVIPSAVHADQNWDGDDAVGNFSIGNNWFGNIVGNPSGFGSGSLHFSYRNNSSQTSLYYDFGGWANTNDIMWDNTFGAGLTLNGNGQGLNFNQRLENNSSFTQTIGASMNLSGAKNGAGQIELNPVNGNLTIDGTVFNDNSKPYYVYGNNGKTLTVNSALGVGGTAANVSFNVAQNSNVIFGADQSYAGGTVISAGSLTVGAGASTGSLGSGSITNNGSLIFNRGSGNVSLADGISGTGSVTQNGSNILSLTVANSYSGTTTVNSGTLRVTTNNALGTTAGGTTVNSGGSLRLSSVNYTTAEPLTIHGTGAGGTGAINNSGLTFTSSTYAGAVTVGSNATINASGVGQSLTFTGGIVKNGTTLTVKGSGSVIVNGTGISGAAANSDLVVDGGTLVVNAASNYNGPTTVQNAGTLVANAQIDTTNVTISSDSTLSGTSKIVSGTNFITVNGALIVGDSTLGSPTASVLELNTSGAGSTTMGALAKIYVDLFSGPTTDNSANTAAADILRLFGTVNFTSGAEFHVDNPNGLTGWAAGAKWKVLDPAGASISGSAPTFFLPTLTGSIAWDTSALSSTGILAIIAVPEPSRAVLLLLGFGGLTLRRRRIAA